MTAHEQDLDPAEAAPPNLLQAKLAERMALAASSLRDVQAWAAAYATMLENGVTALDDVLLVENAYHAAIRRSGDALYCFGASLDCAGTA